MNCSREMIDAYLDEELDANLKAAVEEHLAQCEPCSAVYARSRQQKAEIKTLPRYMAPAELRRSIGESLRQAAARESRPRVDARWRWLAIAASVLLAVSLAWNLSRTRPQPTGTDLLAQNVVADHIRSLMGTHLLDVPSSDQHTVKPWFNGKLDFSPNVKDLAPQGFPLIGGRVDYLLDRSVAALVYQRRLHYVTVFTWPSTTPTPEGTYSRNGYNVLRWKDGGMTYWAVSDLAINELHQFRDLYRQ